VTKFIKNVSLIIAGIDHALKQSDLVSYIHSFRV